ncbi:MAG: hypothetical protein JW776_12165 [Candidatus Lokiarchaeota archaeon]|nr:hypothetical protein [Candidatus Lokiarchaeota archaeon]
MRKYLKYLVPFSIFFILIPFCFTGIAVADGTYGDPEQNWGIVIGDEIFYTLGWDLDLDLSEEIWEMIDSTLQSLNISEELSDVQGHYNNLSSIESVYNVKIGIENITSYFYEDTYYNSSYDYIVGSVAFKAASMDEYGPLNATLIYEIQQNQEMIDYYLSIFGSNMTADFLIGNLSLYGPGLDDIDYFQSWYNSYNGTEYNSPDSPPIFVPTDWDITEFYEELKSKVNYTELAMYANIHASDWNDLTTQLGFTTLTVTAKEADIKYQFSSMNKTIVDKNIYAMNITNPVTETRMETFDELLGLLNITNLDFGVNAHVEWDRKGILKNAHIDFTLEGLYDGHSFKITPVFDISIGEHDRINTGYATIPGYSPYLIVLVGIAAVSGILLSIKKKK